MWILRASQRLPRHFSLSDDAYPPSASLPHPGLIQSSSEGGRGRVRTQSSTLIFY